MRNPTDSVLDVRPRRKRLGFFIGLAWTFACLTLWILVVLGSQSGGHFIGLVAPRWIQPIFQGSVAIAGVLLVTRFMWVKVNKAPWSGMALPQLQPGKVVGGFFCGTGAILLACGIEYGFGWIHLIRVDTSIHAGFPKVLLFLLALVPSLGTGFGEELGFRGYIFETLGERTQTWIAALAMSVIFGLLHFTVGGFGVVLCLAC